MSQTTAPSSVDSRNTTSKPSPSPQDGLHQRGSYKALLTNQRFVFLWAGQIASQLGDRIVFVVFLALITTLYGTNDAYNSWLYIAFTIPAIALTAIAGVFVDRWSRRGVLVTTNLIRAGIIALLPWAASMGLWAIFAEAFLVSTATQFFVPAESATIPAIIKKENLMQANGLFTTTMMASVIFGFALGDPLIGALGLQSSHWAIVGLFLLASGLLTQVHLPSPQAIQPPPAEDPATGDDYTPPTTVQGVLTELKEGLAYLRQKPTLLAFILKLAVVFSAVVALCILLITFSREYLYSDPQIAVRKFAYIISVSGVGMAIGAGLTTQLVKRVPQHVVIGLGCLMFSILLAGLLKVTAFASSNGPLWEYGLSNRVVYTDICALLMGVTVAMAAIPLQTAIHNAIEAGMRGKIMGIQFTILSTCSTLPILLAGIGVQYVGLGAMFIVIAGLVGATGVWSLLAKPSSSRAV